MLHVNDTVRHDPQLLASWPGWARDYYGSRVGKVVEDEDELGWVRVKWDKPAWDDAKKSEALEWSGWLVKQERIDVMDNNIEPWFILLKKGKTARIVDGERDDIDQLLSEGWQVEKDAGLATYQDAVEDAITHGFHLEKQQAE